MLLEDCWVRGGTVGVEISVVGCTMRRCRVQGAGSYGVYAHATFSIEACTIGDCAKFGRGGGILARAGCIEVRQDGRNENRVQRDASDKGYLGYNPDCRGCTGRCVCSARFVMGDLPSIKWGKQGLGRWQHMGQV